MDAGTDARATASGPGRMHYLHGAVGAPTDWLAPVEAIGLPAPPVLHDLYLGGVGSFEDEARQLNAEGRDGDVLVGYSMGGRLALHALVERRAPWSKAVIISADPGYGGDRERVERDAGWAALARRDWSSFCLRWYGQGVFAGAESPWTREEFPPVRREAVALGFERWSVGLQRDLRDELGEVSQPVLWIAGERDAKFAAIAAEMGGVLPRCRVEVVRGAGHRVPWERADAWAALIRSFLS